MPVSTCVMRLNTNQTDRRSFQWNLKENSVKCAETHDSSDTNTCRLLCVLILHRRQNHFFVECKKGKENKRKNEWKKSLIGIYIYICIYLTVSTTVDRIALHCCKIWCNFLYRKQGCILNRISTHSSLCSGAGRLSDETNHRPEVW